MTSCHRKENDVSCFWKEVYKECEDVIPWAFKCPVCLEVMQDPISTSDGHCYERLAIEQWLTYNHTSPMTGCALENKQIQTNVALRKSIQSWRTEYFKEIDASNLDVVEEVRRGATRVVVKGKVNNETVAVIRGRLHAYPLIAGIKYWVRLPPHPHICQFLGLAVEGEKAMTLTEFSHYGSVHWVLTKMKKNMTFRHKIVILKQACSAMTILADAKISHCALSLKKLLIFKYSEDDILNICVKLSDLGQAIHWDIGGSNMQIPKQKRRWAAPESLDGCVFSEKSDVWSFGVLAWELLSNGKKPLSNLSDDEIPEFISAGGRLNKTFDCSDAAWALVLSCWTQSVNERPTFHELDTKLAVLLSTEMNVVTDSAAPLVQQSLESTTVSLGQVGKASSVCEPDASMKPKGNQNLWQSLFALIGRPNKSNPPMRNRRKQYQTRNNNTVIGSSEGPLSRSKAPAGRREPRLRLAQALGLLAAVGIVIFLMNIKKSKDARSAFYDAIVGKQSDVVRSYLQNSDQRTILGNFYDEGNALQVAVRRSDLPTMTVLLNACSELSILKECLLQRDSSGWSILHAALLYEKDDMVRLLLAQGGKDLALARTEKGGATALHYLRDRNEDPALAEQLIRLGGEGLLLAQVTIGRSALHLAVMNNATKLMRVLLSGCRAHMVLEKCLLLKDNRGWTALHYADSANDSAMAALLAEHGGRKLLFAQSETGSSALHYAATNNDMKLMTVLLSACKAHMVLKKCLLLKGRHGSTVLHYADSNDHSDMAELLVRHGGRKLLLARTEKGRSVLHHAAMDNATKLMRVLLSACREHMILEKCLLLKDEVGRTCLHTAVTFEDYDMVDLLLSQGNKWLPLASTKSGQTALHFGLSDNYTAIVKLLIRHGGRQLLLMHTENGGSALHYAVVNNAPELVRLLLSACRAHMVLDKCLLQVENGGKNCLHFAVLMNNYDMAELILSQGNQKLLSAVIQEGVTATEIAKVKGFYRIEKLLVRCVEEGLPPAQQHEVGASDVAKCVNGI